MRHLNHKHKIDISVEKGKVSSTIYVCKTVEGGKQLVSAIRTMQIPTGELAACIRRLHEMKGEWLGMPFNVRAAMNETTTEQLLSDLGVRDEQ